MDNTLIKSNVNFTGSTAIDGIVAYKKAKQNYPNSSKNYYKSNKYILMTFHPVTMAKESIPDIMESVINFIFNLNTYSINYISK